MNDHKCELKLKDGALYCECGAGQNVTREYLLNHIKTLRKDTLREAAEVIKELDVSEGDESLEVDNWWVVRTRRVGAQAILNLENNK